MAGELFSIEEVEHVAVIGAGTMGHGIAQVAAQAGFQVALSDQSPDLLDRARERIAENLRQGMVRGVLTAEARDQALARLCTSTDAAVVLAKAHVVVEAVPERLELKRELLKAAAGAVGSRALLATNTSSLSIGAIAMGLPEGARPRLVGAHFFNPVHIMKLVEVVKHPGTAAAAVTLARAFAERLGKTPIVVEDAPGFASSRLGLVLGLEAMRMVEQGVASPEDIDTAMKLGYGHPMGPLELTDLVGLDVRLAIADYLKETLGDHFVPPRILREKVSSGALGKKAGVGFYRWQDGKKIGPS
jgi:3-hydroxybutyryl-CoA dehydrogenase